MPNIARLPRRHPPSAPQPGSAPGFGSVSTACHFSRRLSSARAKKIDFFFGARSDLRRRGFAGRGFGKLYWGKTARRGCGHKKAVRLDVRDNPLRTAASERLPSPMFTVSARAEGTLGKNGGFSKFAAKTERRRPKGARHLIAPCIFRAICAAATKGPGGICLCLPGKKSNGLLEKYGS